MVNDSASDSDKAAKNEVRQVMRRQLKQVSSQQRQEVSTEAARQLAATPEFIAARTIMIFLSMHDEIDTSLVALKAWQSAKVVVVPKMDWDNSRIIPMEISSFQRSEFKTTAPGFFEPVAGSLVSLKEIELVLVPGLAFSLNGHRLGRGGGVYDRFLGQADLRAITCGYAMETQVLETLPVLDHDVPLSMLVTNRNVRRFSH